MPRVRTAVPIRLERRFPITDIANLAAACQANGVGDGVLLWVVDGVDPEQQRLSWMAGTPREVGDLPRLNPGRTPKRTSQSIRQPAQVVRKGPATL